MLDINKIRKDFPILSKKINDNSLIYLDNAATSQKPLSVIDAISNYYKTSNANTHRGVHQLGDEATEIQEGGRKRIADFINAESEEIVFTRNATESLNLIAYSYGLEELKKDDVIVSTRMEHHANILPWQMVAKQKQSELKYWDLTDDGCLAGVGSKIDFSQTPLDGPNVKLLVITQASNVLGTINPIKEIINYAHEKGICVVVDGAQSIPNMKVDVKDLDADFLVFSGHKMCGPMGIGVLYAKKNFLENISPFLRGGAMIDMVEDDTATWNKIPWKFEAGTPDVASIAGLVAAVDYLESIGIDNILAHEQDLGKYAIEKLSMLEYVKILGPLDYEKRVGLVSFMLEGVHPHDIATILDQSGIEIRAGHHCAQLVHRHYDVMASARISPYIYNSRDEIDEVIAGLYKVKNIFKL